MRLFLMLIVLLFPVAAIAGPDCSNVDPTARMAGCNGIPDFAISESAYDSGRNEGGGDRSFNQRLGDKPEKE